MTPTIDSVPTSAVAARVRPRFGRRILALAVGGGLVTRWALGGPLGLGFFVLVAALVAAFALAGGQESLQQARAARAWVIAALFFAAMVVLRDSPELTRLNVLAVVGLLGLAARDAVAAPQRTRLLEFPLSAMEAARGSLWGTATMAHEVLAQGLEVKQRAPGSTASVVRGLALASPVVLVLTALLSSGDEHFHDAVAGITGSVPALVLSATDWVFCTLAAAALVSGLLTYALRRRPVETPTAERPARRQVGATEGLIVLGSVVLVFAAFLGVQAAWLFAQDPSTPGTGLTYATWARKGFGELTVVALITWWLVELSRTRVEASGSADVGLRSAGSLVLAQALVLLVSAHERLALYDQVYGYTVTRVFAHAGIAFLGLGLLARLVTLWVARTSSAQWVVASALGVLAALNLMNPDAFVVRANLARPSNVVELDWWYLARLSADAAPALELVSSLGGHGQKEAMAYYTCRMARSQTARLAGFNFARSALGPLSPRECDDDEQWH
jgi:hypothetical protein